MWNQVYNPLDNATLSTIAAAIPVVTLLLLIASNRVKAHIAAVIALIAANLVAIFVFTMPANMSIRASILGAITGFFPIGWIVLNVIFLYRLTLEKGAFETLQTTIGGLTNDRRLQLLLIAFSFGAFFEGASGFGTPVAVTGAMLIGLGFSPLAASGLSLIANTAPVAYGALGTPIAGLSSVTGIDPFLLGAMVGRQLPFFSLIVPFWLIWVFAGFKGMLEIWPAIFVAGVCFAIPQFLISNFHGPWLVDVLAAVSSLAMLALFLKVWKPNRIWRMQDCEIVKGEMAIPTQEQTKRSTREILRAWLPWIVLSVVVFLWGLPQMKALLDSASAPKIPIQWLDKMVVR